MRGAARQTEWIGGSPLWGRTGATRIGGSALIPDPPSMPIKRPVPDERSVAGRAGELQCVAPFRRIHVPQKPLKMVSKRPESRRPAHTAGNWARPPKLRREAPHLVRSPVTAVWASHRDGRAEDAEAWIAKQSQTVVVLDAG